jgi:hypothetical protein
MTTEKVIPIPMEATPTPINRRGANSPPWILGCPTGLSIDSWVLRPIGLSIDLWVLRLEIRARNARPYDDR